MIHLLICPHRLDYGGSQLGIHHWARHLDRSRFTVSVLAMARGGLSEKFEASYPVFYDGVDYPNIEEYIRRLRPDIVHCAPGGGSDHEYIRKAAALATVTQTVMCPRQAGNLNDVRGTAVLSGFVLSLQKRKENIIRIDLPFDAGEYDARYGRAHFGLPEGKLIICSIGNARKENAHFMRIARRYENPGAHFVIRSERSYNYLFGRKRVTVLKRRLTEDEKMSLMRLSDIFLYPTSNESYGMVFLEAMANRLPIITYDDAANREVVGSGGLLARLNDIQGMAAHLDRLVKDRALRAELGQKGHELMVRRNDPRAIARKYEEFFLNALQAGKARKGPGFETCP
ncbi:MAG: glycosyltransferase family 4 protein [Deltaproteobacteria bacterium]|nr:glycosyltransferase family 4 protein [Deltaproteobacteria bacterium]MCL4874856.1 glycosyltransferase family 4 protein [bacterium]